MIELTYSTRLVLACLSFAALVVAAALAFDQGNTAAVSGLTLTAVDPGWTENVDAGFRLAQSDAQEPSRAEGEAHLATEALPEESGAEPERNQPPSDLLWHLNWLRNDAGLFGFERVDRLQAMADSYCPELATYFERNYDPDTENWADAMVHDAGGPDLTARAIAVGFGGWSNELLAWTAEEVDLSLVARGFWDAPTHTATLTGQDPTLAGAAVCQGDAGYFYVVVIGGGASPSGVATGSHNPFVIP